jgi:hypothetical protein
MEAHFEADIANSTEILFAGRRRIRAAGGLRRRGRARRSARRALRTVTGVGHSIGAAALGARQLEHWESLPLVVVGVICLGIAALGFWKPVVLAWPALLISAWIGLSFLAEAFGLARRRES